MIRKTIDGIECVFYEQNLYNDNLVLIKYGSNQITTNQAKIHIDNVIDFISNLIEVGAIFDDKLEKYATALTVYKAMKSIFSRRTPRRPSVEDVKIAIDVTQEIALMDIKDPAQRTAVKSISFVAKFLLDVGDSV